MTTRVASPSSASRFFGAAGAALFGLVVAGAFAATKEMARHLGEEEFSVLFHQGKKDSIHLTLIGDRTLMTIIFDERTTIGLAARVTEHEYHFPTDGSGAVVDRNAFSFSDGAAACAQPVRGRGTGCARKLAS